MLTSDLYLACINLAGRRALVVGAGRVGLEKIQGLIGCDAEVTVVAPEAVDEVKRLASEGPVQWVEREYRESDLEGNFLVVAATSDTELNTLVYEEAERRSMLVNVVDVPELCNFILPAVVRQGPIAVGISTAGASPALAKRMKREIAEVVGPEYARLAKMLDEVRPWAKDTLPTYDDRKVFFEAIVNGDPDPLELLRNDDEAAVRTLILDAQREAEGSST